MAESMEGHTAQVYGHAYRLTGDCHEAEDLTQDVFLRALAFLERHDPTYENVAGWLYRITYNLFVDHLRHQRIVQFVELSPTSAEPATDQVDPARIVSDRVLSADVQAALGALSTCTAQAIVLHDIHGMTYAQIADHLGVTRGTVASRLHRGHAKLRDALPHRAPATPSSAAA